MPHLFTKTIGHSRLALWRLEEDCGDFLRLFDLNAKEKQILEKLGHEKRRKEWLGSRALLRLHLGIDETVSYDGRGKPQLPGSGLHISISH